MALALHEPDHGYYAARVAAIGGRGDFTTAPCISPAFPKAVAAWLLDRHRASGIRDVIELGPGNGILAERVRHFLPWLARHRLRFHFVESSPQLRALQQKAFRSRHAGWHDSIPAAMAATEGRALIYSNEFLDAFPVRRFRLHHGTWRELGVTIHPAGHLAECLLPGPPDPLPADPLPAPAAASANTAERHDSIHRWLASLLPLWQAGSMLSIDYGFLTPPRPRPHGSVRAYLLHQRLEGEAVYQNPGRQDITADIDFASLRRHGEQLGLRTDFLTDQASFLLPHVDSSNPADRAVTDPLGAGTAFLVLAQNRRP